MFLLRSSAKNIIIKYDIMKNILRKNTRAVLSSLWTVIMINMIYNDIFTIMVELDKWQRPDFPDNANVKTLMLIAGFVTNIPIMMIFLSRILEYKINRWLNIGAALFAIVYIWGGRMPYPHYTAVAIIETIVALVVIGIAWKWQNEVEE